MTEGTKQIRTYKPGDIVRIVLYLEDPSGVGEVAASFVERTDSSKQIYFRGDGNGGTSVEVILERNVTEGTTPGAYDCYNLRLHDSLGNFRSYSYPGISFRVEEVPGDHDGPEFRGWRYA